MKTRVWMFVLVSVLTAGLGSPAISAEPESQAAAPKTVLPRMKLADGDTIVFLGDSITHQCLYTQYVEDFYYTRFPKLRIHFHNAGVGGDRAADALGRFDDDVAAYKPKYVTILLGMNDGAYREFDKGVFDTYQRDMTALLDRVAATGATAIAMTPTMHDARAHRLGGKGAEPRDTYYNGVLALYGAWLREMAQQRGLGFVDMYSPLNNLTLAERKEDAVFTLIPDAIHPAAPGQVVMAAAVLADVCPRRPVSSITIEENSGQLAAEAVGGKIADFQAHGDTIRFTFTADALPWVLPREAVLGYQLLRAGPRYSLESLAARNLKPGTYELKIDGQSVGRFDDATLAFRVELEGNEKTPQYQQALAVAMLNKERNEKAMHPLRDLWLNLKIKRARIYEQGLKKDPKLAAAQAELEKWRAEEFQPGVAKLQTLVDEYEEKIYEANQPVARKYELIRVE